MNHSMPAVSLALAGLLAPGCGGGGGGGSEPPAAAELQRLAFVTGAGELMVLDPQDPAAGPITVDTGLDVQRGQSAFRTIQGGTYQPGEHALTDPRHVAVVYLKQGQVFRLGLSPGDAAVPARVSAVTGACAITERLYDYADPASTRLVVTTAGADLNCATTADNGARFIALGDDESAPGTSLTPATFAFGTRIHAADGSLQQVLVREGPTDARVLRRYSADLQEMQDVAVLESGTSVDFSGPVPTADLAYLRLRPAGTASACLYRYTVATHALSGCLQADTGTAALSQTSDADNLHLYFATGSTAWRLAHGVDTPEPVHAGGASLSVRNLRLSAGRVVLNAIDTAANRYRLDTFPREGGTATVLQADSSNPITLATVADRRIYFQDEFAAVATARLENGDGPAPLPAARWGGFSLSPVRVALAASTAFRDAHHGLLARFGPDSTMTLTAFEAQTGAIAANLGRIAGGIRVSGSGFGRQRLLAVTVLRSGTSGTTIDTDVYFADTRRSGSLRPLAATAGANDWVFL